MTHLQEPEELCGFVSPDDFMAWVDTPCVIAALTPAGLSRHQRSGCPSHIMPLAAVPLRTLTLQNHAAMQGGGITVCFHFHMDVEGSQGRQHGSRLERLAAQRKCAEAASRMWAAQSARVESFAAFLRTDRGRRVRFGTAARLGSAPGLAGSAPRSGPGAGPEVSPGSRPGVEVTAGRCIHIGAGMPRDACSEASDGCPMY